MTSARHRRVHSWTRGVVVFILAALAILVTIPAFAGLISVSGNYVFSTDDQSRFTIYEANGTTNLTVRGNVDDVFGVTALSVQGRYAYVASTNKQLYVFDVSNPTNIEYISQRTLSNIPYDIAVQDNFAFIAEVGSVLAFDLSNPEIPNRLFDYEYAADARALELTNKFLFAAEGVAGLGITDMSGESGVRITNRVTTTPARKLRVNTTHAFVACDGGRLEIVNIQNLANPTPVGTFLAGTNIADLDLANNAVILAKTNGSILTLSITNPAASVLLSSNFVAGGASAIRVVGNTAFIRTAAGNTVVQSLASLAPIAPSIVRPVSEVVQLVGTTTAFTIGTVGSAPLSFQWSKNGVALTNDARIQGVNSLYLRIANLAFTDSGNYSVLITNALGSVVSSNQLLVVPPGTPVLRSTTDVGGEVFGLDIQNNLAYIAAGLNGIEIYDVRLPRRPVALDALLSPPEVFSVRAVGEYVFVANGTGGFKIFDTREAGLLSPIGGTNTTGTSYGFDIHGGLVYLADGESGLQIINASSTVAPFILGTFDTPGIARAVRAQGDFAYIADGSGGLRVLAVTNPAAITQVGHYAASTDARNLRLANNTAYVASGTNGLLLLSITNPAVPVLIASYSVGQNIQDVEVVGNIAILAKGAGGVETIDISNPNSIFTLGVNTGLTNANALTIYGDTLGVADGVNGFKLFEIVGVTATTPDLTNLPISQVVLPGENVNFQVAATGLAPLRFQWFKNGVALFNQTNISGAAANSLVLAPVDFSSTAEYRVEVRNAWNLTTNYTVSLTVVTPGTPVQRYASGDAGDALRVQVVGQLAYIANRTAGLQITDCRNPLAPVKVGQIATASLAQDVFVRGHLAFTAVWSSGLEIFDVSNPTNIVRVGGCDTPGLATGVHVVGTRAYISDAKSGLACVDVSDPANPRIISSAATFDSASGVFASEEKAYVAASGSGLQIFNVANPLGMSRISHLDTPGSAEDVTLVNGRAYVSDYDAGVRIVNVTNPSAPQLLGSFDTLHDTFETQPLDTLAYLAQGPARVESLSITNPAALTVALQSVGGSRVHGLQVSGKHAFIADRDLGLVVSELLGVAPVAPQIITAPASATNIQGSRFVLSVASEGTPPLSYQWSKNGIALAANTNQLGVDQPHLQIPSATATNGGDYSVVVSSPYGSVTSSVATVSIVPTGSPVARGVFDTPGDGLASAMAGHLVFIADGAAGLRIVDANNPDALANITGYAPTGTVNDVFIQTNLVFIALGTNGLEILDVTEPASPTRLGGVDTPGNAIRVIVQNGIAYVADGASGLQIINVTNPASPTILGAFDTSGFANDVKVSNGLAFIADGLSGLQVVSVTNATSPTLVANYDTAGNALAINVTSNRAYIADGPQGLVILSVTNPAAPALLGSYPASNAVGVDVAGSIVIVANANGGYYVLDASNPASISTIWIESSGGQTLGARITGNFAMFSAGTNGLRLVELFGITPQAPAFITQPVSVSVAANGTAHFRATVSGSPPLICRWFYNDEVIFDGGQFSGATTPHLMVNDVSFANSGSYVFRVWNPASVTNSATAQLNFIGPLQAQINSAATGGVINVASGTLVETLLLDKNITLVGSWWNKPTLDAQGRGTVVRVLPGVTATLRGISIRGGNSSFGGGVLNEGNLTLDHCLIANNSAATGGGIANYGTIQMLQSVVSNNVSSASGGGVLNQTTGTMLVTNSVLMSNISDTGGGVQNFGTFIIAESLVASNHASGTTGNGGGLWSGAGSVVAVNSTFSGNSATASIGSSTTGLGGGVRVDGGSAQIVSSTIAFNGSNFRGGGVSVVSPGTLQSLNSIYAKNNAPTARDFHGTMDSLGYNLVMNPGLTTIIGVTTGNRLSVDPLLQPLADNGGATLTHMLAADSPAIDAGIVLTNSVDQRGIRKPFDVPWVKNSFSAADIGAFEYVDLSTYLTLSNRTQNGFTLAWPTNAVLQKALAPTGAWVDQTNTSPVFVSTVEGTQSYYRLRAQVPLSVITTNNQTTNSFDLSWPEVGILEHAPTPEGPWEAVTASSPHHVVIVPGQDEFFRLRVPAH
jgi:hypothetical protein